MTRKEIEVQIYNYETERRIEYITIKNKLVAGEDMKNANIPIEFMDTVSDTLYLSQDESMSTILDEIREYQSNSTTFENDILHIRTTSELTGDVDDDCVSGIYFYISSRKLRGAEDDIDFGNRNSVLMKIIRTKLGEEYSRAVYVSTRYSDNLKFLNGEIEFEELVNCYRR